MFEHRTGQTPSKHHSLLCESSVPRSFDVKSCLRPRFRPLRMPCAVHMLAESKCWVPPLLSAPRTALSWCHPVENLHKLFKIGTCALPNTRWDTGRAHTSFFVCRPARRPPVKALGVELHAVNGHLKLVILAENPLDTVDTNLPTYISTLPLP